MSEAHFLAVIDGCENIDIPYAGAVEVLRAKNLSGRDEAGKGHRGKEAGIEVRLALRSIGNIGG